MKAFAKLMTLGLLVAGLVVPAQAGVLINGAGATFPYPIYSKWFDEFGKLNSEYRFNYQSIGSGGGIRQVTARTVDFGATDGPMTDEMLKNASGKIHHIPTVLGAVVVTYNLPGVQKRLQLSNSTVAGIFLGKIKNWNDPAIQKDNPGAKLPKKPIIVAHRSDGSGTTFIMVDFLSKVSPEWESKVGRGTSVAWPVGIGGKGNEGVAGLVKQMLYSIGYVELIYALQNKLAFALVQNKAGKFADATLENVSAAAKEKMPADFRVSITNSSDPEAYPISGFTWLLIYDEYADPVKGKGIVSFLEWMIGDGQKLAAGMGYAPLPDEVKRMVRDTIKTIKVQ